MWTATGLMDAHGHGVEPAEVEQALFAPVGLRFERDIGDTLLVVMGMANSGRVIAVLCDRIEHSRACQVLAARALSGPELDDWRRQLP